MGKKSVLGDRHSEKVMALVSITDAELVVIVEHIAEDPRYVNVSDRRILLKEIARRFYKASEKKEQAHGSA